MVDSSLVSFHDFNVATRDVRVVDESHLLNEVTKNTYLLDRAFEGEDIKQMLKGGKTLKDHIQTGHGSTFGPYEPGQIENPQATNHLKEITAPWTFNRAYYVYDEEEEDLNDGDKNRYIAIKRAYELQMLVDTVNGMEDQLLALPDREKMEDTSQTKRSPFSLLAFITRDGLVPSSTNGGLATGSGAWTTLQTVNRTTDTWWQNKNTTYNATALDEPDDGLVSAIATACRTSQFKMPKALKRYMSDDTLKKQMILTSENGVSVYEARLRMLNDRMSSLSDPSISTANYKGIPVDYIADLDDLGWTAGQPDYIGVNWNYIKPRIHTKWYMKGKITDGGSTQPNRHTSWKFLTWQLFMQSGRRQFRVSAAS